MSHSWQRLTCLVVFIALTTSEKQTRWSRQISSYTADISDWVPLSSATENEPPQIKRQAVAEPRILAEPLPGPRMPEFLQEPFPSRAYFQSGPSNQQLYLQTVPAVPSAPQNYLNEQGFGHSIRFGLSQPSFGLSQGFVGQQYSFDNSKPRPISSGGSSIKFDSYPKPNLQLPSPQAKPFVNQSTKQKAESPKFIDGYRLENTSNNFAYNSKKRPQSLQKLKFENYDNTPSLSLPPITQFNIQQKQPGLEKEEVQLLYVPVESLGKEQLNFRDMGISHGLGSDIYSQLLPKPNQLKPQKTFQADYQRPVSQTIENFNFGQDYISNLNVPFRELEQAPKFSTLTSPFPTAPPTTLKPKKLKPHQPPLAVFLAKNSQKTNDQIKVGDVLSSLKSSKTVAVLDAVNNLNSPEVFIGPFSLTPPENYVKFELPYLSNIDNTDKKLRHLPFFVAPLSYNTPDGFAKIPFPSPHVGSVVINSRIKDTTDRPSELYTNSYSSSSQLYSQEKATQKPEVVYYTTSPQTTNANTPSSYQSYSFEPQTVTSVSPQKARESDFITASPNGGYYLSNYQNQYNQQYVRFPAQSNLSAPESVSRYSLPKTTSKTTTTTTTTTTPPSTYSSPLLETHNPYSINHAFHFSTPVDYHNFFEEYKESYGNPGFKPIPTSSPVSSTYNPKPEQVVTEMQYKKQSTPNYLHSYSPEIHYESEAPNYREPAYTHLNTKPEQVSQSNPVYSQNNAQSEIEPQQITKEKYIQEASKETASKDISQTEITETQPTVATNYNQFDSNFNTNENKEISSTTTRQIPTRPRGRPRYTTTPRTESNEASVRPVVTRKPIRKPLHRPRPTYDTNKVTTEKSTKTDVDLHESTTKSGRTRTRGHVHFKSTESDQTYEKPNIRNKDYDLAYQRDVLHQNYPVTLTEKLGTTVETVTEPLSRFSSTKDIDIIPEHFDTENAYTNEKIAVTQHETKTNSKEDILNKYYTESQTESSYAPRQTTYIDYQTRSSSAPVEAGISSYGESSPDVKEYAFAKETFTDINPTQAELTGSEEPASTEPVSSIAKEKSIEQTTIAPLNKNQSDDINVAKVEATHTDVSYEEQTVHTTPSYNRVRVRPGLIKQYHQASSTEPSKNDRRKHVQAVTYRPAFDKRRTTMRIDEIEADLKTKQVRTRPDFHEYRQPVYRPDTTSTTVASSIEETTTRRNNFRRRRPTHTTSSTEASSTKGSQENRLRQRTRRPIEKSTSKHEEETSSSTTRSSLYKKYTRPRLSQKYNKKTEDAEDQDSNYSLKRPQFATPENDNWSAITETDSFKPYNPNELTDDDLSDINEPNTPELVPEIITAKNEYDDILLTVTPALNNIQKEIKIPEIPPTLEAFIERSKTTKSDGDMTTFESMLEEVMKSLDEQDKDEYTSKAKVMKHKGGEIGEIPPESVITSEETIQNLTTQAQQETTTVQTTIPVTETTQLNENEKDKHKGRRRGFWKKVKRPANTESIEVAESQFYGNALNTLGEPVKMPSHEKNDRYDKKLGVTTYKPSVDFLKDVLEAAESEETYNFQPIPIDISKISKSTKLPLTTESSNETTDTVEETTKPKFNPGDLDLGTGSPDPTIVDYTMQTEATTLKRSDTFSFMDYLFGVTASDEEAKAELREKVTQTKSIEATTEQTKSKTVTTETSYVPDEITTPTTNENTVSLITTTVETKQENSTEKVTSTTAAPKDTTIDTTQNPTTVESSSTSSFMDPTQVLSTSMSTEVSHETEICFRGKCFKSKDLKL